MTRETLVLKLILYIYIYVAGLGKKNSEFAIVAFNIKAEPFLIKQTHCGEINFLWGEAAVFYHGRLSEATPFSSYPVILCTAVYCSLQQF